MEDYPSDISPDKLNEFLNKDFPNYLALLILLSNLVFPSQMIKHKNANIVLKFMNSHDIEEIILPTKYSGKANFSVLMRFCLYRN